MFKFIRTLMFCGVLSLIFSANFLFSTEKIISKISNVDLVEVEKFSLDGVHFGSDLYVSNHNDYPVQVSIKVTDSSNMKVGLIDIPFIVEASGKGYFGWLIQDKKGADGKWNVEWFVNKVEKVTKATEPALPKVTPAKPSLTPATPTKVQPTPTPAIK